MKICKILLTYCLLLSTSCVTLDGGQKRVGTVAYSSESLRLNPISEYVNSIAEKLARQETKERLGFSGVDVSVLKTSRIQGSAYLDSRQIKITRGMLNVLTNEAELACLIGHEIGHKVLHRHRKSYKPKNILEEIFVPEEIAKAKWDQGQEQEADEYGALLCKKAGYDPYAFLTFFERLSQFQRGGFFAALEELTATHKDFRNRAKNLREFLEKEQIAPAQGKLREKEYIAILSPLRGVTSNDAINELLPGGPEEALEKLGDIERELRGYQQKRQAIPVERFLNIMEELSKTLNQYGITESSIHISVNWKSYPSTFTTFMKEILSQDTPIWANQEEIERKIENILALLGRLGVGFIPVVGDAVDLYEFLTGEEFGTGYKLSFNERVITVAGLLAGSGKVWREAANGIELTLKDARLVSKVGRRVASDANRALGEAKNIGHAFLPKDLFNRSLIVV